MDKQQVKALAESIKSRLKESGHTQQDLADALGVVRPWVARALTAHPCQASVQRLAIGLAVLQSRSGKLADVLDSMVAGRAF